jgi:hypothetical protein
MDELKSRRRRKIAHLRIFCASVDDEIRILNFILEKPKTKYF